MQSGYLRSTTHAAPHSRIFAMCQTVAGLKPRITGSAAKMEVSLERPARITSAPLASASIYGSIPHMPTMCALRSITASLKSGALASGVIFPSRSFFLR
ncbi:hypothetical protein D3C83_28130 [compost metagenome]